VYYKVLFAAKATGHCALQSVAVFCSQSNWSLYITKFCCFQPKQQVTVHYKALLLFEAKATGHCALPSVVICSQIN
jgi:hypothetical protein